MVEFNMRSWDENRADSHGLRLAAVRLGLVAVAIGNAQVACAEANLFLALTGVGHWNDVENWTAGHLPQSGETAFINDGRTAYIYTPNPATVLNLNIADYKKPYATEDGTLNMMDGASLHVASQLRLAVGANNGTHGVLNQSGGELRVDDALFLAFESTHVAEYNLSGGNLIVGNLWFRFGIGTIDQTGGAVSAQNLILGEGGEASRAMYLLRGGTLDVSGTANIGKGPGSDSLSDSFGSILISSGTATLNDVQFGVDEQDFVRILNDGALHVRQSNYPISEAIADIAENRIRGAQLFVSTIQLSGQYYTSIVSLAIPGDYNLDGEVNAADYTVWRDTLNSTADLRADGNGNARVDEADYDVWKTNFANPGRSAIASQAVPEPTSGVLFASWAGIVAAIMRRRALFATLIAVAVGGLVDVRFATAQVQLSDLTDLAVSNSGADYYKITVPSSGQVLSHISPSLHQGNADVYPVDPRVTIPGDLRRMGIFWSQFLMGGTDPTSGQYFLTDWVESEGQRVQDFQFHESDGKFIEYEGTWTFRNLFTSKSHCWIWVDGDTMYQRVQTSLEVHSPIKDVGAIWTELFNTPDAFETVALQTRDDGLQSRDIVGATNKHYLTEYQLGRDDWIAFVDPRNDQAASVARVLLSSTSDIRAGDEVTPIWADATLFDNIELHVHRSDSTGGTGADLAPGTSFFMDNLLVTSTNATSTSWVNSAAERGKEWIELIGPPIETPATAPVPAGSRSFLPAAGTGNWATLSAWNSGIVPQLYDSAKIGARRTAVLDSPVSTINALDIGDTSSGTLLVQPGADLLVTDRIRIGAGAGAVRGTVVQAGGSLGMSGENPVLFMAFDEDDAADYSISGGRLFASTIWFRFGQGTMNQSGGTVGALQLVLGEGGGAGSRAIYNLSGGVLAVIEAANIGKGLESGDPFANSNGILSITGGAALFGDLLFGNDPTDMIQMSGTGSMFIREANYSLAEAWSDINSGRIRGSDLMVTQVEIENLQYVRIATATAPVGPASWSSIWDLSAEPVAAVPEPTCLVLVLSLIFIPMGACGRVRWTRGA